MPEYYLICISDRELLDDNLDNLLAGKLHDAGYDVGYMLWTMMGRARLPLYSGERRQQEWLEAFKRAGITEIWKGRDEAKMRQWFKVFPRPEKITLTASNPSG